MKQLDLIDIGWKIILKKYKINQITQCALHTSYFICTYPLRHTAPYRLDVRVTYENKMW